MRLATVAGKALALPLAAAYGCVGTLRRHAYRRGYLTAARLGVPVLSVGTIAAGGSGKTPITAWLARRLLDRGLRVGVVHGAYGGSDRACAARLPAHLRWERGASARYGDESVLLAGWLGSAIVTCGRDKVSAASLAVEEGAQVLLVDDGFQHCRLHRDLDLVLHRGGPWPLPLPSGMGRELAWARSLADLVWEHRRDGALPDVAGAHVTSRNRPEGLISATGRVVGQASSLRGQRVFLIAGIAEPADFVALVRSTGAQVVGTSFVRDHHALGVHQLRRAARSRADLVLCTEKDAARMAGHPIAAELVALSCGVELTGGGDNLEHRLASLGLGIAP